MPRHSILFLLIMLALAGCGQIGPTATPYMKIVTLTPRGQVSSPAPTVARAPATNHTLGPENALLTIIMYGDFQCELCLEVARNLAILRDKYAADTRLVFRHFPQPGDDKADLAAQAAEAASAQGKFWEMHDQLYAHQPEWKALPPDNFRAKLNDYAKTVGLDASQFSASLDKKQYAPLVAQSLLDAQDLQLKGVPVLLFNGTAYSGRVDLFALENYVKFRLLEKRWLKVQPALQIDLQKKYSATLKTEKGDVEIQLYADAAPVTVNNFVALARLGWYDDITFHLVIPNQLAQSGDPSGSGYGGPGYTIIDEAKNGLTFDREGVVALASTRGVPNSGGSQFFISLAPLRPISDYDGQFTIFGTVTKGMDVLRKLTPRNLFDEARFPNPPPGDKLISVTITEG